MSSASLPPNPPQIITAEPVQTAEAQVRDDGAAPCSSRGLHASCSRLYRAPSPKLTFKPSPPKTIISFPVHTAALLDRPLSRAAGAHRSQPFLIPVCARREFAWFIH